MDRNLFSLSLLVALLSLTPVLSHADDEAPSETKVKLEDISGQKNKTPGEDVDESITNNQLRAMTGSKSRWSIASQFNYLGGTINNAFGGLRPNVAGASATPQASMIQGQISAKYNIDGKNSIMAGTGLDWVTPFQGASTPSDYNRKVDVYNPYLLLQHLYTWEGIQSALQFQPTLITQTSSVDQGYAFYLQLAQDNVYEIGKTGLSLGLYLVGQYNPFFNKSGSSSLPTPKGPMFLNTAQADYSFGADPFIEYQLTDKLNLRTVFNFWNYDHWLGNPNMPHVPGTSPTLVKEPWLQSVGVGIAITRDIFLYPNIQFLPEHLTSNMTNVALSSYINLF